MVGDTLLSGYLALEALLIDVKCKKRYVNVWKTIDIIQYNTIQFNTLYSLTETTKLL